MEFKDFSKKVFKLGNTYDVSRTGQIQNEGVGGSQYEIITGTITHPKYDTIEQYRKVREDRLNCENNQNNIISASNISDDRFIKYEQSLFGEDLRKKGEFYANEKNHGYNAHIQSFGRRDLHVLTSTNPSNKGLEKADRSNQTGTLYGRHDVDKDYQDIMTQQEYFNMDLRKKDNADLSSNIPFDKIMEYNVRNQLGLMNGRQVDVSDIVRERVADFNKIDVSQNNDFMHGNCGGMYQAGLQRREFIDNIQRNSNNNIEEKQVQDIRINPDSYYNEYGYGSRKIMSALIDIYNSENTGKINGVI